MQQMKKAISYCRVSTDRQGESGLGLEAQQASVTQFTRIHGYNLEKEYVEVESGKKNARPQLQQALLHCKKERATLIIAKLDRLSRNLHFISGLIEAGIDFKAVDMPDANKMMLQIHGVFAEYERDMISSRTKQALQASKKRGKELGKHGKYILSRQNSQDSKEFALKMKPIIASLQKEGYTSGRAIVEQLNQRQISTFRNSNQKWHLLTVQRLLKHFNKQE